MATQTLTKRLRHPTPRPSNPRSGPRSKKAARRREARVGFLFLLPTLAIFAIFKFLPIFGAGAMSLTKYRLNGDYTYIGTDNYSRMVADPDFWQALKVTGLYVVIYVPLIIVVSLGGAVLLDRTVRYAGTFRWLLFLPYLSSFVMAGIVWTWIFASNGPLNAALGGLGFGSSQFISGPQLLVLGSLAVVSCWKGFGYSMLIFLAGLKALPEEVNEAARIDGAGGWRTFWHITLPLLRPVTLFVLMIETIVGFQVFDTIYVMTGGGPNQASFSLIYFVYDEAFKFFDFGYAAAAGVVFFAIVLVLSLIQYRLAGKQVTS